MCQISIAWSVCLYNRNLGGVQSSGSAVGIRFPLGAELSVLRSRVIGRSGEFWTVGKYGVFTLEELKYLLYPYSHVTHMCIIIYTLS
jgi:hypothetical protein